MAKDRAKGRKERPKSRRRKILPGIFVLLLFCVLAFTGFVGSYLFPLFWGNEQTDPAKAALWDDGRLTVLLIGSDRREGDGASRSDTMMLVYIDMVKNWVRLVSIPRDTFVQIPSSGEETKINHAYAYGGIDLTKETLSANFGIDVDYYVDIEFQGFIEVIDAIGGVPFDVPKRMYYPAEGIDLNAGSQTLNGDESLQFVRYRSDALGDLGRIERQQDFMKALSEHLLQIGNVLKIPAITEAITENVDTDFSGKEILRLFASFHEDTELTTYVPPGAADYFGGISYFLIDEEEGPPFFAALNRFEPLPE